MKILPFRETDAEDVAKLSNENVTAFQYHVTPSFLKRMCANKHYKMFVLKDAGQIIGFCGVNFRREDVAELGPVCVKSDRRMHGLGRVLVARVFEFLEPLGHSRVVVKAKSSNKTGREFFSTMGFNKIADVSCRGAPAVLMEHLL
jgi:N-acetylglutamate synthase-like GNAT family acetyltransferase